MNDSELFLCPGAAFSHLRTSPTCDMMGTTKVSENRMIEGKTRQIRRRERKHKGEYDYGKRNH